MCHRTRSITKKIQLRSHLFDIGVYASPYDSTSADWETLRHQQEALWYLMQRECGPVSPEFSLWRRVESDGPVR